MTCLMAVFSALVLALIGIVLVCLVMAACQPDEPCKDLTYEGTVTWSCDIHKDNGGL